MADFPIQGKLRMRPANFERDLEFIRARVGQLSEPELKSYPGFDYLKFWYADFAATLEQWQALQPELEARDIMVTMYEAPALIESDEPTPQAPPLKSSYRSRYRWLGRAGAGLIVVSLLGALLMGDLAAPLLCAAGIGLMMMLVGGAIVAVDEM